MESITSRQQLVDLKAQLGVRDDWHEPDEQDVTAGFIGSTFDNAGTGVPPDTDEMGVILFHDANDGEGPQPVAYCNIANLLALATDQETVG